MESDRGEENLNSVFQNFLRINKIHQYSQFTNEGLFTSERVMRTIRN